MVSMPDTAAPCMLCTQPLPGMTETSPASFMTSVNDELSKRLTTVGKIMPHTVAKVVDVEGRIVPRNTPGELWVAGYNVQAGYFNDPQKTRESTVLDEEGIIWMKTGDEAILDEEGYCRIIGRIKDIIIRGMSPLRLGNTRHKLTRKT
jgi:long-subunit acyl-CoA synthetase (AMP-forming)